MQLSMSLSRATVVAASPRVLRVAAMFGLGVDEAKEVTIVPPVTLDLHGGQVVFITGASGGGKSSLLRLITEALGERGDARMIRFDELPALPDRPLVDCLVRDASDEAGLARALKLLSLAGLADAFVVLRSPGELSDGQRYRLRLAQAMEMVESSGAELTVVLADEFAATLDRITAMVIARNVRKWTRRCGRPVCFIAATTHDDLLEALEPDVLIEKGLGGAMEVAEARHGRR